MTILAGEGVGSVVETHATPLGNGRTAMVEATLATSDAMDFGEHRAKRFIRPAMAALAKRLWVDDGDYAERTAWLRNNGKKNSVQNPARFARQVLILLLCCQLSGQPTSHIC